MIRWNEGLGRGLGSAYAGALLLASLCAAPLAAQTIAITGGQVHTGTGEVIENGTVVLVDGRIAAVGANATVPTGATRVDATGKVVTAGFFDAFTGLGVTEVDAESNTVDRGESNDHISAAFQLRDALNPFATNVAVTRVDGITRAIVAPQSFGSVLQGQGMYINLGGASASAMVERSPVAMYATLGESGAAAAGGSRAAAMLLLREALDDARDYARNREAYEGNRRRPYALGRLDLEALVPVVRGDLPLVVSAHRASDILAALQLKDEYGLQLVIAGAGEGWMVADELRAARVPVITNATVNLPTFETLAISYENAARMAEAGVEVVLSTFDVANVRNLRQEAGMAVSYGMDYETALRAVTVTPARVFGLASSYGVLESGNVGDVVVWSGDPFEVTTAAERVFIDGQEVPPDTRQRALLERYRSLSGYPPR
ncbi:MAG: amidohydrolase family protein [Gemmatimonadota bacterium]